MMARRTAGSSAGGAGALPGALPSAYRPRGAKPSARGGGLAARLRTMGPLQLAHVFLTCTLVLLVVYYRRIGLRAQAAALAMAPMVPVTPDLGATPAEEHAASVALGGDAAQSRVKILEDRIGRKDRELEVVRRDLRHTKRDLASCQKPQGQGKAAVPSEAAADPKELERLRKRDKAMTKMLVRTKDSVARLSREVLHRKFGEPEPFRVRITVAFPASMGLPEVGEIDVELASSELMPTAVLYFLNQVEAGLWNGCSFIRNAGHVLQASPQTPARKSKHHDFKQLAMQGLSIPFQEYSEDLPHVKYTVGIAGRPGGPDFYISTIDNKRNHGPGGQGSYDLPEEADPCFGTVVSGVDVVKRMQKAPTDGTGFKGMTDFIEIRTIEMLT